MLSDKLEQICLTLRNIIEACTEFQRILRKNIKNTSNPDYKTPYSEDIVILKNVKKISMTVIDDIENDRINLSTELILRFAAEPFAKKIDLITENITLRKKLIWDLEEVHKFIYRLTIERGMQ